MALNLHLDTYRSNLIILAFKAKHVFLPTWRLLRVTTLGVVTPILNLPDVAWSKRSIGSNDNGNNGMDDPGDPVRK